MKTFKILFIIAVLVSGILIGCSENNNPLNSFDNLQSTSESQAITKNSNRTLLWCHEGLKIKTNGERIVNAEAVFQFGFDGNRNILITYDGWATPDTSCYISQATILLDNLIIHTDGGAYYINGHHELEFEHINGERLRFYLALWHDEIECISSAKLSISNIKIYNY